MPSSRRAFHIGDVLTVALGIVLSPRRDSGVAAVYGHLCGRPVAPNEMPDLWLELRDWVLRAYPEFSTFSPEEVPGAELQPEWLRRRAAEFGEFLPLAPLPADHPFRDPPRTDQTSHRASAVDGAPAARAEPHAPVPA